MEERASPDLVDERAESAELEEETKKEESAVNLEAVPVEKADALARQMQLVVVNRGDYLCKIIQRTYGYYSDYLLGILLSENPDIDKPDYIVPGQVIELPATNESN